VSEVLDQVDVSAVRGQDTRRSWSRLEKRRIVEEAFRPGASVAEVARSYGLNANQVFNWRRRAVAVAVTKTGSAASAALVPQGEMSATPAPTFLPIGMIVQTNDDEAGLVSPPAASELGSAVSDRPTVARPPPDERSGLIEIDLACGTRLRVDAFVNERALRRVLSVLKALS
jgi:transposase